MENVVAETPKVEEKKPVDWIAKLKKSTAELRVTGEDSEANPTLELALLMDCTSSMSSWINKAKETLNEIIDKIVEESKEEGNLKVRVCFVGYRDIKDRQRFTIMEFTDDIDAVREFIKVTLAEGGGDTPEDLQGGLKLALHQDWTEEASKRVVVICDAPCHGKQYHDCDESYPNGSPDGLVLEDLMKEFCKKDIEFSVIKLHNNCNKMIEVMKQCHQELEVSDMTGMQPSRPSYSESLSRGMPMMAMAAAPRRGPPPMMMGSAAPMGSAMRSAPGGGPPPMMMGAPAGMAPPPMPGCGAPMAFSKMSMAPAEDMMCDELNDMDMMTELKSAPKRDMASEAFISSTVKNVTGQIRRNQDARRAKKM